MMDSRTLGDYNLIKQVGMGSMGTVFLAEHRFMKKQYILKVLPEELASDRGFVQRFEEDVSLLATLEHPNIVKIHTVSFAQGQYFLVTDCVVDEFSETTNLFQYLQARGKRFDEEVLFRLLRQVAEALDYAHNRKNGNGKGIVHRNLKLNNILVSKGLGGIDLRISDFGLTRLIGPGAVLTRSFKAVAESLGIASPLYQQKAGQDKYPNPSIEPQKLTALHASFLQNFAFMAPEQKRFDKPESIGPNVDIYAFGILAYYLLVGEYPEGLFDMPSKAAPEMSWNWDPLIYSCLHPHPEKRQQSLVAALDAVRQQSKGYMPKEAIIEREKRREEAPRTYLHTPDLFESTPKPVKLQEILPAVEMIMSQEPQPAATIVSAALSEENAAAQQLRPIIRSTEIERPDADYDPSAAFVVDPTVKQYTPERKEIKNIQPLITEMAVIPGGTFQRGSSDGNRDEMPRHQISLSSFALDIHPITNEQFVRFLEVMGGEKDSNHQDIIRMRDSRIKRSGGKLSIESGYAKHPVVGVTWYGAIAYAKWVGKRLPTEAEWEVAARGGFEGLLYPTGEDIEKTQANFFSSDTTAVMSYAPNGYGLYDMAGNVYEWCYDWYGYNYYEVSVQEPENPKGPLQGVYRVLRGGCWKSLKEDLRCSRRHRNNPGTVNGTYGFRCAADVQ